MSSRARAVTASYLVLRKQGSVLLLRRKDTGYMDGNYSLVAGHVEAGESFLACAVREAAEEAGISVSADSLSCAHVMHRLSNGEERVDVFFVVDSWEGAVRNLEPAKCDDLRWFDSDRLPDNIIPYIAHALGMIRDGVFYSEYGWE